MNKNYCSAVYVDYKFKPFPYHCEDSLHEFLWGMVMADLDELTEEFTLQKDAHDQEQISHIRYQFRDIEHARERYDEVGWTLNMAVERWEGVWQRWRGKNKKKENRI
jgi:hypothetical protein